MGHWNRRSWHGDTGTGAWGHKTGRGAIRSKTNAKRGSIALKIDAKSLKPFK